MLTVDDYELIRRMHVLEGRSIREIRRRLGHSRNTIAKVLAHPTPPGYRMAQPRPKRVLEPFLSIIDAWLEQDQTAPRKQRHTGQKIYERLCQEHEYRGSVNTVRRYLQTKRQRQQEVFMPLAFEPGQEAQVDWHEAVAKLNGVERKVQVFCMRLCYSKASFTWPYERATLEAFLDGHVRALAYFGGVPKRIAYDGLNRRLSVSIAHAAGNPHNLTGTVAQSFEYDGLSRKTRCTDDNAPATAADDIVCTYAYDTLSRTLEQTHQIGSFTPRVQSYEYDESLPGAGNLQPTAQVYSDGRRLEYQYDDINRQTSIADDGFEINPIVTYDYIGRTARVLRKQYQNGVTTSRGYDGIRRVTQIDSLDNLSTRIVGFEYGYDQEDNRTFEDKLHHPSNSELYTYDSADRLNTFDRGLLNASHTAVSIPTTLTGAVQARSYTLDGLGNWASPTTTINGSTTTENRAHTNFNEIVTLGSATLTHDDNGNQADDGELLLTWDALNRLREARRKSDNALIVQYAYSCDNKRMVRTVSSGGKDGTATNGTTHFYYAGWRVCEEFLVSGSVESATFQYVWGATYLDELITRDDRSGGISIASLNNGFGSERQFQLCNAQFSVHAVMDEAGGVLERYQYDPYGNVTVLDAALVPQTSSAVGQEFLYTGQRRDVETELFYYKNRYYNTAQGRFISRDPLEYIDSLNLYEYVTSQSIQLLDPSGKSIFWKCGDWEWDGDWEWKFLKSWPHTPRHLRDVPKVAPGIAQVIPAGIYILSWKEPGNTCTCQFVAQRGVKRSCCHRITGKASTEKGMRVSREKSVTTTGKIEPLPGGRYQCKCPDLAGRKLIASELGGMNEFNIYNPDAGFFETNYQTRRISSSYTGIAR